MGALFHGDAEPATGATSRGLQMAKGQARSNKEAKKPKKEKPKAAPAASLSAAKPAAPAKKK